jgi:hypothetical protein
MQPRPRQASYDWNVADMEDGWYDIKIVCSDERNNPTDAKTAWKTLGPILIDNRKPSIVSLQRTGELTWNGVAEDSFSHVARIEYNLDGGEWRLLKAADGVFDERREQFTVILKNVAPGEHVLSVRVFDEGGNIGMRQVGFKIEE